MRFTNEQKSVFLRQIVAEMLVHEASTHDEKDYLRKTNFFARFVHESNARRNKRFEKCFDQFPIVFTQGWGQGFQPRNKHWLPTKRKRFQVNHTTSTDSGRLKVKNKVQKY